MWPLLVVFGQPGFGELADLANGVKQAGIEHFFAIGTVEALDRRVLIRLGGLDEVHVDLWAAHHSVNAIEVNSEPLSTRKAQGLPCIAIS